MQHKDLFPDEFPLEELLLPDNDPEDLTEPELLQLEPIPSGEEEPQELMLPDDESAPRFPEEKKSAEKQDKDTASAPSSGAVYREVPSVSSRFFGDIPLGPENGPVEDPEDDDDFELFPGIAGNLRDFRAARQPEPVPEEPEVPEFTEEEPGEEPPEETEYEPLPLTEPDIVLAHEEELPEEHFKTEPEEQPAPVRRSVFDVPMWDENTPIESPEDDDDFELFSGIAGKLSDFRTPKQEHLEQPVQESEPEEPAPAEEEPEIEPADEQDFEPLPVTEPESAPEEELQEDSIETEEAEEPAHVSNSAVDIPMEDEDSAEEEPEDEDDFELFSGIAGRIKGFFAPKKKNDPEPAAQDKEPETPENKEAEKADEAEDLSEEPEPETIPAAPEEPVIHVASKEELREAFYGPEPEIPPVPAKRSAFDIPMWDESTPIEDPEEDDDFELFFGIAGNLNDFRVPKQEEIPETPETEPEEAAPAETETDRFDEPEYEPLLQNEPESVPEVQIREENSEPETAEVPASVRNSAFDVPMADEDSTEEEPEDEDDFELFSGIAGRIKGFFSPKKNAPEQPVPEAEPEEPELEEKINAEEDTDQPESEPIPDASTKPEIPVVTKEELREAFYGPEPETQPAAVRRSVFDVPMWDESMPAEDAEEDDDFELFSGIAGSLNDFHAPKQEEIPETSAPEPAPEGLTPEEEETENGQADEPEYEPLPLTESEPDMPVSSDKTEETEYPEESQTEESEETEETADEENEDEDEADGEEPEVKQPRLLNWFFRKKPGQKAESIVVEEAEEPEEKSPEIPVPPEYKAPAPVIIHSVPLDVEPEDDGSPITLMPDIEGSLSDFIPPKKEELIDFSEEETSEDHTDELPETALPENDASEGEGASENPEEESEEFSESDENEFSVEEEDEESDSIEDADAEAEPEEGKKTSGGLFARLKKSFGRAVKGESEEESEEEDGGKPSGEEPEEESEEEEQGFLQKAPLADIPPRQLSSIFGAGLRFMRVRVVLAMLLALPLIYLNLADSLNLPIYLIMWDDSFASLTMLELLAIILVLNFDTLISGLLDPFRGNATLASIPVYAAIFTMADCAVYALVGRAGPYPCAGAAGLAVAMTGLGHYYHRVGDRSTCRAAAMSSTPERISRQKEDGEVTDVLLKCGGGCRQFGSQVQESDGTQQLIGSVGLIILLAGIALAGVSILNGGSTLSFFWFASVILTAASPLAGTLAYGMPYRRITARLAQGGAAIAGWKGVVELNAVKEIVLNDSDFFPSGMVKCSAPHMYNDTPVEEALGYAATLIHMGGCGVDGTFAEQVYARGAAYHFEELTDFRIYEDGGYGGRFGEKEVIIGTAELMDSLEIPFTRKLASRTALFCAINGELTAHFNLNYTLPAYVLSSLEAMDRAKIKGILATRDFNLSPENLKKVYSIPVNKLRIAEIDERIDLTPDDSPAGTDLGGLLCRAGIDSHIDTIIGAKRLYRSARKSSRWLAATAVVGMALGAYLTIMHAYTALEPINLLIFMILWSLPPILQGTQADKY